MTASLLDRLQESKLRLLEDFIESYSNSATAKNGHDQVAALADFFVDEGLGLRLGLMRFWDYYWTAALTGKVADLRKEGMELRALLERGAALMARAATAARTSAELASGSEVARLAEFEEQSNKFSLWVEECMARWELLERPHKPLDRERIARGQVAFERGECEPVSDIVTRLEQGGALVQE